MSADHSSSAQDAGRRTILLIADDDALSRELLLEIFRPDYEVHPAKDGREVLALLEQVRPDLFILDLQMPELGGVEVVQRLRKNPRFRSLPVIALTTLAAEAEQDRALEAGFDLFLTKPIRRQVLCRAVSQLSERVGKPHLPMTTISPP